MGCLFISEEKQHVWDEPSTATVVPEDTCSPQGATKWFLLDFHMYFNPIHCLVFLVFRKVQILNWKDSTEWFLPCTLLILVWSLASHTVPLMGVMLEQIVRSKPWSLSCEFQCSQIPIKFKIKSQHPPNTKCSQY